jgi:hypothetical protein
VYRYGSFFTQGLCRTKQFENFNERIPLWRLIKLASLFYRCKNEGIPIERLNYFMDGSRVFEYGLKVEKIYDIKDKSVVFIGYDVIQNRYVQIMVTDEINL